MYLKSVFEVFGVYCALVCISIYLVPGPCFTSVCSCVCSVFVWYVCIVCVCMYGVCVYGMCMYVYDHVIFCIMFNLYYTLARLLTNVSLHNV